MRSTAPGAIHLGLGLLLVGCLAATAPARAEQPRFYLSTDRVFTPGDERVEVQLEARGLPHLDFRLYRIAEPERFFLQQGDLHRISTQNGPKRASSLDVAGELWRLSLRGALQVGRRGLSQPGRSAGRRAFPEQLEALEDDARQAPAPTSVVPLLKDFELVDMWREPLGQGSEWTYRQVALNAHRAGAYLVEAVYGQEVGYTVVILSRLTLLTRQSRDQFLVWAVDPELGRPVAGARVQLRRGQDLLAEGTTDADGRLVKDIPLVRSLTVFARRGDDFAVLDPSYHPANLFSRKVYLTTERPVYRPGQPVFFKGIVRAWGDERYRLADLRQVKLSAVDPNGQQVHQAELTVDQNGTFHGSLKLFDSAALGTYRLIAEADDKEYGAEFKVKAYRKPEYRVRVSTARRAYVSGEKVQAEVAANYFFGPPVAAAKVKVSVYRTRFYVPWWIDTDYAWYYSDAEYRNTTRETIEELEGRLDAEGKFRLEFETRPDSLDYTYGIEATVTDAADRAVGGHGSIRVTRARFRLVLEPEYLLNAPGQPARVKVITSDYARQPVPAQVELEVIARQGEDPARASETRLLGRKLDTGPKGQAWLSFEPERGGSYQVRARAVDQKGNRVETRTTLFVTAQGGDIPYAPAELELVADRRSYRVGDKARFLLLVPQAGAHLLVTVEGGRLYRSQVVRARGTSAVVEIPIEQAQTPNFFIKAATVFDRALYERRLDVVVPPREKLLDVAVAADRDSARPGQEAGFTVRVRDDRGQPVAGAQVALALVDEAVYGISPEIAVPIAKFFYHRKRNDVRSSCSLDFRFYGYGRDTRERMAALHLRQPVVPGSFKQAAATRLRTEFRDTLGWYPDLTTDEQGLARVKVRLPDNLTTWRATARVVTRDTRVGQGLGRLLVTKPVVVRLAAPVFLVEGDQASLGLLVHNYSDSARTFQVSLQSDGDMLSLTGRPGPLQVPAGGVGQVAWRAEARRAGVARLRARASADDLADGLEQDLPVRAYGLEQVLLAGGLLDDQHPEALVELKVPEPVAPDSVRAGLQVSSGVAPALLASLKYLSGYPYGCTEQTMSRFLPDLVVAKALGELGMQSRELEEKLPGYIQAGLARLAQLQHGDGGWGWWESDATDAFMTAYVVHGLALARDLGWQVPADMLSRGAERLKVLVRDVHLSPTRRSYLLYSLALAGVKYESMLSKLLARPETLTDYGKALLSLALFELGRREQAAELAGQIDLAARRVPAGSHWGAATDQPGWESDPVESTAAALRSLLLSRPDSVNIPAAVRWLMSVRDREHWQSTRDTAMAVFALVDYLKRAGAARFEASVEASLNGQALAPVSLEPGDVFKPSIAVFADRPGQPGANRIALTRRGRGALFYNAAVSFFGREDPIAARGESFQIERSLFVVQRELRGDEWHLQLVPLSGPVRSGQELLVLLDLRTAREADYIMVEDALAAGVQPIERDRGYRLEGVELQQPGLHREFSDQKAAFFLAHLARGRRKLAYLVRATLPGDYHLLPARVMPMYDPQFAGNSASDRLRVED